MEDRTLPHFINGVWKKGSGELFSSYNPASGELLWRGHAASAIDITDAVGAASRASLLWAELSVGERYAYLLRFRDCLKGQASRLAEIISMEMGKPKWEAFSEVNAMIGKVEISFTAYNERCHTRCHESGGNVSITRHKPIGILAVFGPFNFPGHLPNGHIVPALLAGNCLIFKPSELTPSVGETMVAIWEESGLPPGVLNLVQGGRSTGELLASSSIDGLLFTGSWNAGQAISQRLASQPQILLALEMGGNNPLIVSDTAHIKAAAYLTIQSAFITSGQRCSCASRLILPKTAQRERFIETLVEMTHKIKVGTCHEVPEPFMGPVINKAAAERLLQAQKELSAKGGISLKEMKSLNDYGTLLSPGIIDITSLKKRPDQELFGPLLRVICVENLTDALEEANATEYGLAAGFIGDSEEEYRTFYNQIKAGVVNRNCATTGASSAAPFGGTGKSGNHRPSAFYAADYCAYPVASAESTSLAIPDKLPPGLPFDKESANG